MTSFLSEVTPAVMRERLQQMETDTRVATLRYIMGNELLLEWAHSLGVTSDTLLRQAVSPVPPLELRSIVAAPEEEVFLFTGVRDARIFFDLFSKHAPDRAATRPKVLDFACGCGRMTRYFDMMPAVQSFGSDINPDLVAWCSSNLRNVITKANGERPPLSFDDNTFDMAYSLSLFTHLDEGTADAWLAEMHRVLSPSGILLITTHGYPAITIIRDSATHHQMFRVDAVWAQELLDQFAQRPFVFLPYAEDIISVAKAGSSYGNTFIHPDYAWGRWQSERFTVVEHIAGGLRGWQDIWVLRKN